jgi:tetratricopeptide (TPR) repeat protein
MIDDLMSDGVELANRGQLRQAAEAFMAAIKLHPEYPEAFNNLGTVFLYANDLDAAKTSFSRAIALRPDFPEAHNNIGIISNRLGYRHEAEVSFRKAIELNPNNAEPYNNLGLLFHDANRQDEAAECFRQAIYLNPLYVDPLYNLATVLVGANRLDEAIHHLQQAINLRPAYAEANFALGMVYLLLEEYDQGWQKYEARCLLPGNIQPDTPCWQGQNLTGKTILLYHEQGIGDTLQFFRYVPQVAKMAAKTIVWVQKPLERLLSNCSDNIQIKSGDRIPLGELSLDFACPLLSLPGIFKTTTASIPQQIPYIFSDPALVEKWGHRLADASNAHPFRIGVVWAGNAKHKNDLNRSIPLETFSQLFSLKNITWVNLQVGRQIDSFPGAADTIVDFSHQFIDFADTAATIQHLDLIITVDTALAHLAGSMGKPTWLLIPFAPDWRWQMNREDSPWYPTIRIFRQTTLRDWPEVLARVADALKDQLKNI